MICFHGSTALFRTFNLRYFNVGEGVNTAGYGIYTATAKQGAINHSRRAHHHECSVKRKDPSIVAKYVYSVKVMASEDQILDLSSDGFSCGGSERDRWARIAPFFDLSSFFRPEEVYAALGSLLGEKSRAAHLVANGIKALLIDEQEMYLRDKNGQGCTCLVLGPQFINIVSVERLEQNELIEIPLPAYSQFPT